MYKYDETWTEEKIYEVAKHLEGKTLGQLDKSGWLDKKKQDKGAIGNMIQSDFFGIPANSIKGPDFIYHDVELKVTPVLKNSKGFSSKERLVLGMINYMEDYKIPFEKSIVFHKAKVMLVVFYLHEPNTNAKEFKILKTHKFTLPDDNYKTVQEDYNKIVDFIKKGSAENLSERNHDILSPCTKGQGKGKDFVKQPFSNISAKSRAYSFKVGFMSKYFRILTDNQIAIEDSKAIEQTNIASTLSKTNQFDQEEIKSVIENTLNKYVGKTIDEISDEIEYSNHFSGKVDKSANYKLLSLMFGATNGRVNATDLFVEADYEIKTVVRNLNKSKNQDMSFPNIDFKDVLENSFEDSQWSVLFGETTYVFCYFDETTEGEYRFTEYLFYTPSDEVVNSAKELFELTKRELENGVDVQIIGNRYVDSLPTGKKHVPYLQIRTKGTKTSKFVTLPDGVVTTKKCLFMNKEFINQIRLKKLIKPIF